MTCDELREVAPELAVGLLTGPERASALAHLERCRACRAEVASLADVGEALLALAPDAQPAPGFETRVLARIAELRERSPNGQVPARRPSPAEPRAVGGGPAVPRAASGSAAAGRHRRGRERRGRVRGLARLAAAAAVVAIALVAALLVGHGDGEVVLATTDMRTSDGEVVGQATLRADPDAVVLDLGGWADDGGGGAGNPRTYWLAVEADHDGGWSREVYAVPETEHGPWHVAVDGAEDVTAVSIVDDEGRVWCRGSFQGA